MKKGIAKFARIAGIVIFFLLRKMKKNIGEFMGIAAIVAFFFSWFAFVEQRTHGKFAITMEVSLRDTALVSLVSLLLLLWAVIIIERQENREYRQGCKLGL